MTLCPHAPWTFPKAPLLQKSLLINCSPVCGLSIYTNQPFPSFVLVSIFLYRTENKFNKSHNSSSHGICEVNAWSLWGGLSSGYCPCSSACIQPWKKTWTCENWNRCEKVQGYDHYDDFVALERDYKRNRQETGDGKNIVEPCDACKQIKDPQLARMLISDEAL